MGLPSSPARGPAGPTIVGLYGRRLVVWTLGAVGVGLVIAAVAAFVDAHLKSDAEQERCLQRLEASLAVPREAPRESPRSVPLAPVAAANVPGFMASAGLGECVAVGEFDIVERPIGARVVFAACRGERAGCSGSGANWLMVRTCRGDTRSDCIDAPALIPYGVVMSSPPLDVSAVVDRPGRYAVSVCDAGCADSPSEAAGPCCGLTGCGVCEGSSAPTRCTTPLRASAHVYGHFSAVEYATSNGETHRIAERRGSRPDSR